MAIVKVKCEQIAKLLRLFKACATGQMYHNAFKLLICQFGSADLVQSLLIMEFELTLKVIVQIGFFINLHKLVAHILQGFDKPLFQCCFALCCHIMPID